MVKGSRLPEKKEAIFPVAAIGASAGGLKALTTFFEHVPEDIGIAFIVVQHLSPTHKSMMGELLKRHTALDVVPVEEGMSIRKNTVYLSPADKNLSISRGIFHLTPHKKPRGLNFPIDSFLRSLAEERADQAICVLLSGSGTDGIQGLEAIKGAGGMTAVQDEQQADYGEMPHRAIETGLVDLVLPAEEMGAELMRYMENLHAGRQKRDSGSDREAGIYTRKILLLLRSSKRHDFTHYKQSTIRRRIERRMVLHKIDGIADYYSYLQQNSHEEEALFKELLIGVTSFFRDQRAFQTMKEQIIPSLLKKKKGSGSLRIWIPGCATGEEAYSIAILVAEEMNALGRQFDVKIFATDIDGRAIEKARKGIFPDSIAADISPERLKQCFWKGNGTYRIKEDIRDTIIFSIQDLVTDPPFTRLDLISCRNVLIYMDGELQKKVLPLFHYALKEDGYLFLGSSESTGQCSDLFRPVQAKSRIFLRKDAVPKRELDYPPLRPKEPEFQSYAPEMRNDRNRELSLREMMESALLEHFSAPSVLINERCEALYFHGATERYLTPSRGEASLNILKMCREDLRPRLSILLHRIVKEKVSAGIEGMNVTLDGESAVVDVKVKPLHSTSSKLFVVAFEERKSSTAPLLDDTAPGDGKERATMLEKELLIAREHLQSVNEELEATNEELKSTNEELQSTNEELLSTNDELETAKEELQSTNEELITVNSELQSKVDELTSANNDIGNLLAGIEIPILYLDTDLRIKHFTPAATKLFDITPQDPGRYLRSIATGLAIHGIDEEAEKVLISQRDATQEVSTVDGLLFIMRIVPCRTAGNTIEGVIITFIDITEHKRLEEGLINARNEAEESGRRKTELLDKLNEAQQITRIGSWDWDIKKNAVWWSDETYRIFGVTPQQYVPSVGSNEEFFHPDDRDRFRKAFQRSIDTGEPLNISLRIILRDGTQKYTSAQARVCYDNSGAPERYMGTIMDITDRVMMEQEQGELRHQFYQAQKMEAIGTLAGGIAHDFNNLLGGIMSGLSLLEVQSALAPEHRGYLREMEKLCRRGSDLTKQLLGFARKGKYDVRPVNLNATIERIAAMFGRTRKDIMIHTGLCQEDPAIMADETQIEQVILNLLVNAGQAMPQGGDITIATKRRSLSTADIASHGSEPGRYVVLTVEDNGIGMSPEIRDRIFEPFFTTKETGRGSGLGLASAFGIVKSHGGFIAVESTPGKGSLFTVFLPESESEPAREESEPEVKPRRGRETILIVDDEEQIVKTSCRLLATLGYEVLTACSGMEATELFKRNHQQIDLVILDMIMPEVSGRKVFDALRAVSPSIRVLVSSGYSLDDQAMAILETDNTAFIQKPYGLKALSEKLRDLL